MYILTLLILIITIHNSKSQDLLNTNCVVNIKGDNEIKEYVDYEITINKRNVYFKSNNLKTTFKIELKDTISYEKTFYNEIHTIVCDLPDCTFKIEKIDNKISMVAIKNEIKNYYIFYLNCSY